MAYTYTITVYFTNGEIIKRGCECPRKAIEFAKYMIGYSNHRIDKNF